MVTKTCIHQSCKAIDLQLLCWLYLTDNPAECSPRLHACENILRGGQSSQPRSWPLLTWSDIISLIPLLCLCAANPLSVSDRVWLGQMFASRDDAPLEPGNSREGSPVACAHSDVHVLQRFQVRGVGRSPVGLWGGVGGWGAWCSASPSALFHFLLMS